MKIEIDTKRDSKEELIHISHMLQAIAGNRKTRNSSVTLQESLDSENAGREERPRNIFEDPSPTAGFMNIFGDSTANRTENNTNSNPYQEERTASSMMTETMPRQNAPAGDLFSIFGSSPTGTSAQETSARQTESLMGSEQPIRKPTMKELLGEKEDNDLLNDIRIVPY